MEIHDFTDMMNKIISEFINKGYKFSKDKCTIIMTSSEENIKITFTAESEDN